MVTGDEYTEVENGAIYVDLLPFGQVLAGHYEVGRIALLIDSGSDTFASQRLSPHRIILIHEQVVVRLGGWEPRTLDRPCKCSHIPLREI
jgi:hypothetical protein